MRPELQKKVEQAIKLIQSVPYFNEEPIEVAYSGGKDSDVILELVKMAGVRYRAIYKNTTIDPPGTIQHCKENGVEIIQPKQTFFELMQSSGIPGRFYRFCCDTLKEYKVLYNVVIGVRRGESTRRAARYHEPIVCRVFNKKKDIREQQILPILYWTTQDILEFIEARQIKLHPIYYREDGTIDMSRRLGCLCCPLQSRKKRIEEFKRHPRMLEAYIRNARIYWESHPDTKTVKNFRSVEEWCFCELMCESYKKFQSTFIDGLFPVEPDWFIDYLEREFKVSLRESNKNY